MVFVITNAIRVWFGDNVYLACMRIQISNTSKLFKKMDVGLERWLRR